MADSSVLGVICEVDGQAFLHHLADKVAVTPDVLALAGTASVGHVFRIAAACATSACSHFDGEDCRLASKLIHGATDRVKALPPCRIRRNCRWYVQEGKAACFVCPLILSETAEPTRALAYAANPDI